MASNTKTEIIPIKNTLFNIPIYKMFNEKSAILVLNVKPSDGTLSLSLAPSTLIGKTEKQTVVPKGTKIYDYSREVFTNLTYAEVIALRDLIKNKIDNAEYVTTVGISAIMNMMVAQNNVVSTLISTNPNLSNCSFNFESAMANFNNCVQYVNDYISKCNAKLEKKLDSLSIYRKNEAINEKKTWNFNFSTGNDGRQILYVSVIKNDDKASKIYIGLGETAVIPLYNVLQSYITNASILNVIGALHTYNDGEVQTIKCAEYLNLIKKIYGDNLELCDENSKAMLHTIVTVLSDALITNMVNSKNLRDFTGRNTSYQN